MPRAAAAPRETPIEIVFVVDTIRDWRGLVADLPAGSEFVVIDGRRDGLAQIAAHLRERRDVTAVHVLSHGDVGRVQLGSIWLDATRAEARRDDLATIGRALRPGADILLYGCAVASDGAGRALADAVAALTGADVAASRDATGAEARGGNWTLEFSHGTVSAQPLAPASTTSRATPQSPRRTGSPHR